MFMIQGGLPGASCDGTGSQDANLSLHTDTADLQSDNRRADQYSEYNDDGDDVNILPLPEEDSDNEDQRTVIEVPAKDIGAPMIMPMPREKGEDSVETGEETAQETKRTAEKTAPTTVPTTTSREAAGKATAKRGPARPHGTCLGVLNGVSQKVLGIYWVSDCYQSCCNICSYETW